MSGGPAPEPKAAAPAPSSSRIFRWLDERYDLAPLVEFVRHKRVPVGGPHSSIWYYMGGITLFLFLVQVATGALLLLYYRPGEQTSYESTKEIVTQVPFGWLVRSVHCWSAHLMVLFLIVHMLSVFFAKAYRKPRELTWVTGFLLFGVALGFGFSGYLLPWNELAFFATAVGTDSAKAVPVIGHTLVVVLRGGEDVTIRTLHRFLALHVVILPLVAVGLIAVHLVFVQRQGMAPPLEAAGAGHGSGGGGGGRLKRLFPDGMPFVPNFALRDLLLWVVVLNVIAVLAVWLPYGPGLPGAHWDLGKKADPLAPAYPGIKPEWYFLWVYQLLKELPPTILGLEGSQVGVLAVGVGMTVWALVPFLDRRAARGQASPGFTDFGLAVVWAILYLTLKGADFGPSAAVTLGLGIAVAGWRLVRHRTGVRAHVLSGIVLALVAFDGFARKAHADETPAAAATWPEDFRRLLDAERDGRRVVSDAARRRFVELPAHAQKLFFEAVDSTLLATPEQLAALLALDLSDVQVELLAADRCILCHTDPTQNEDDTLLRLDRPPGDANGHLDLREVVADVHFRRGLGCAGCHGGDPRSEEGMTPDIYARWPEKAVRKKDRTWVPEFCARCHADPTLMRRYDPALPVDQLLKYRESRHGERLLGPTKDSKAAQCVSCHGAHGIRPKESPQSQVHPQRIPETCGRCHADAAHMAGYVTDDGKRPLPTDQLERFRSSVHGRALLEKGDLGAPACNDCHGNHAAMPPAISHVSQVCRTCHSNEGQLFDGSPHKKAFEKHGFPECETCHGNHAIARPGDELVGVRPPGLCGGCHEEHGKPECNVAVEAFAADLAGLRKAREAAAAAIARADAAGMETEALMFDLAAVDDAIVEARAKLHAFDRAELGRVTRKGVAAAGHVAEDADRLAAEDRNRRRGLLLSTLAITAFATLLYLKIRRLDRRTLAD